MIREILKYPDKRLTKFNEEVKVFDDELKSIIADMKETMNAVKWGTAVGLAAPQIGINKRIMIVQKTVCINPVLIECSMEVGLKKEGCYSLDAGRYDYPVFRSRHIKVQYQDETGKIIKIKMHNYEAQIFQHEFDHVEGRLCHQKTKAA